MGTTMANVLSQYLLVHLVKKHVNKVSPLHGTASSFTHDQLLVHSHYENSVGLSFTTNHKPRGKSYQCLHRHA